jgi:histidyl-tRNA synthetase
VITDSLCEECRSHFAALQGHLDVYGVPYDLNPTLVRGLDYYTKTVFEFWAEGIGAQNAVGGGGRYDGLAESLGGARAPGIGFGIGLDRVILSMQERGIEVPDRTRPQVFLVCLGDGARRTGLVLGRTLRTAGIRVASLYGNRSMRAQMRQANTSGAAHTLILGEDELAKDVVTCRDMASGEQNEVPLGGVAEYLKGRAETPQP